MDRIFRRCLLLLFLLPLFCLPARADMGPKPSVTVTLEGLDGRTCWGTLLSQKSSTGPYSAIDQESGRDWASEDQEDAGQAFLSLDKEVTEGFYVMSYVQDCSDGTFSWGYYPPGTFKLALWFPEEDAFLVGPVRERYAFDSYFTLDLSQTELVSGGVVQAEDLPRDYPYGREMLSLIGRALLTVALELAVAWLFKFRSGDMLFWIIVVNLVTQGLLNLGLNVFTYFCGALAGVTALFTLPVYVFLELVVTLAELAVYRRVLAFQEMPRGRITAYAWTANACSCAVGVLLSFQLPGLF